MNTYLPNSKYNIKWGTLTRLKSTITLFIKQFIITVLAPLKGADTIKKLCFKQQNCHIKNGIENNLLLEMLGGWPLFESAL